MFLCASLPCPALQRGPGLQGERCAGEGLHCSWSGIRGSRTHRGWGGGEAAPSPAKATPGALRECLHCVSSARREEPALPRTRRQGATPPPRHLPPSRASLAAAAEKRRRAGSSRQSVAYPPSPHPVFLGVAAATARGPALQNGGCSLFAATGPRRFHPPLPGTETAGAASPPPSKVKILTDTKREGARREPALNSQPTRPSTRLPLRFSSLDKMAAGVYAARLYIRASRSHVTSPVSKSEGAAALIDNSLNPAASARPQMGGGRAPPQRQRREPRGRSSRPKIRFRK